MRAPDGPAPAPDGPGGGVTDGPLPAGGHLDDGAAHAFVDGALADAAAARVITHVAGCAACAALVAEARGLAAAATRILGALDEVPGGVVPAALEHAPRHVRGPARPVAPASRAVRRWTGWPVRAAAALLLVAGVGSAAWRARPADDVASAVPASTSAEAVVVVPAAAPAGDERVGGVATAASEPDAAAAAGARAVESAVRRDSEASNRRAAARAGGPALTAPPAERAAAGGALAASSGAAATTSSQPGARRSSAAGTAPVSSAPVAPLTPAPAAPAPSPAPLALSAAPDTAASDAAARAAERATADDPKVPVDAGVSQRAEGASAVRRRAGVFRAPVATADAAELPAGAGCYVLTGVGAVAREVGVTVPRRVELGVVAAVGGAAGDREPAHALTPVPPGGAAWWRPGPGDSLWLTWVGADDRRVEVRVGPADGGGVRAGIATAVPGGAAARPGPARPARARAVACAAAR